MYDFAQRREAPVLATCSHPYVGYTDSHARMSPVSPSEEYSSRPAYNVQNYPLDATAVLVWTLQYFRPPARIAYSQVVAIVPHGFLVLLLVLKRGRQSYVCLSSPVCGADGVDKGHHLAFLSGEPARRQNKPFSQTQKPPNHLVSKSIIARVTIPVPKWRIVTSSNLSQPIG
jgi:hypothetical protein